MNEIFIISNSEKKGPFTLEELKNSGIDKETFVWYNGLEDWKKAEEIDFLKAIISSPIKSHPPEFVEPVEKCEKCNGELTPTYQKGKKLNRKLCHNCDITPGICPFCKSKLRTKQAQQCPKCGRSWHKDRKYSPETNFEETIQNKESDNKIKCPKCKSTDLTSNKKGYSFKKGAAGLLIPGGVLWGFHGRNKIKITCLKCGHTWKAGK